MPNGHINEIELLHYPCSACLCYSLWWGWRKHMHRGAAMLVETRKCTFRSVAIIVVTRIIPRLTEQILALFSAPGLSHLLIHKQFISIPNQILNSKQSCVMRVRGNSKRFSMKSYLSTDLSAEITRSRFAAAYWCAGSSASVLLARILSSAASMEYKSF